jgi:TPR repeat protein
MKSILVVLVACATAGSVLGQAYSVTRHRERIQQATGNAQPATPAQAPQARAVPAATAAQPVDAKKAAAQQTKKDQQQFEFYKRRAEEGSDHAQYELGMRYLAGKGVAPNELLAREWIEKSAKTGYAPAVKKLAELPAGPPATGASK